MGKTKVICVKYFNDVAHQRLSKLDDVSRSYSKKIKVARFLKHSVVVVCLAGVKSGKVRSPVSGGR